MSDQPASMTSASFVNQNWNTGVDSTEFNQFTKVDMNIYIYENENYDSYVTYLNGAQATSKVDEGTDYLTTSVL